MSKPDTIGPTTLAAEGIDFSKLKIIFRKNLIWILALIVATNLSAYLYLRWTKNIYESQSELKLDIKQDPSEFGLKNIGGEQNMNIISGEIEQIRSRLFFSRVVDSMNLWVSYHAIGQVLSEELYNRSPFEVLYSTRNHPYLDRPINFNFTQNNGYILKIGETKIEGQLNEPLQLDGLTLKIRKTGFYELYHDDDYFFVLHSREGLVNYMLSNITVAPLNFNANTIRISFRDFNPHKAQQIVNKIDSIYLGYSYELKNQTNRQKISWLNNELNQIERKMGDYEDYFKEFTLRNKSFDVSEELNKTIASLYKIDSQRYYANRRLTEISQLLDQFENGNFSISLGQKNFLPTSITVQLEQLNRLHQEKEKLIMSYNDNTLAYRQKENDYTTLKSELANQLSDYKKETQKLYSELGVRQNKLEGAFSLLPDKNTEFIKNQRFYKLYEGFYLSMMQSRAEFEIAQAGSTPDFKILSSASLPGNPISPKRGMIYGIGFSSGIIVSIFFLGLLYIVNDKITSTQEIENLTNIPLLATIPESRHTTKTPFHVLDNPKSMVSESIRTLRTNLDFFASTDQTKTITISSTIAGEGKSFLALNLGGVIAMSKKKAVLLDLDMRKSKRSTPFPIPDQIKGVSTVLIGKYSLDECIVPTGLDNFDYVPAGPTPPNPSELLMNTFFDSILEQLKKKYDFIIIDTPPIGLVTDGIMAMKRTDVSIYVVRANYSKKEFLHNLERVKSLHSLNNMSIVFNAVPTSTKLYGYGYYEDQTPVKKTWKNFIKG